MAPIEYMSGHLSAGRSDLHTGLHTDSHTGHNTAALSRLPLKNASADIPIMSIELESTARLSDEVFRPTQDNCDGRHDEVDPTISISSTTKIAGQTVAPFLAKHIPEQYAPLGVREGMNLGDGTSLRDGIILRDGISLRGGMSLRDGTRDGISLRDGTIVRDGTIIRDETRVQEEIKRQPEKNPNTKYCYRHRPDSKCKRSADEPSMENLQRDLESLSQADQQGISHVWSLFSAAPAKHRNLMLQGILTQCCFPQLSYLSTTVRDLIRIDFITALPAEVSYKILCYLDTTSLCKAAQVSQRWRSLADDDVVWHKMCEQHIDRKCTKCGWGLPLLEQKRLRDWKRQRQLRATGRGVNEWSPEPTPTLESSMESSQVSEALAPTTNGKRSAPTESPAAKRQRLSGDSHFSGQRFRPWKDVYKDRFKVGTNWKYGRCTTKIFRGHTNGVMCLQFDDNILATGSYDSTIKIWDIESGDEIRTLHGHTSGIRALQFDDRKLISGSLDMTLKVWNWRTGECISTFQGHTGGIISLHFDSNILASGSVDKTVKIWNFEDKSTFCLKGHKDWVNAVKLDSASRTVFSASDDCTVRLWDLDTKSCIKVFEGHVGQVQQVLPLPADYEPDLSGNDEDDASSTASIAEVILPDSRQSYGEAFTTSSSSNRPLPPRYMLTGALDSTVRLWDVSSGKCLKTFFGHVEGVWALASDTLRVVSGAQDRMTKVWDARTGKCEKTFSGHAGPVTCIGLSDSRMCTGSEDCEVRLYSFKTDEGEAGSTPASLVG